MDSSYYNYYFYPKGGLFVLIWTTCPIQKYYNYGIGFYAVYPGKMAFTKQFNAVATWSAKSVHISLFDI